MREDCNGASGLIRTFLISAHRLFAEAVTAALQGESGLAVAGYAATLQAALGQLKFSGCEVLLWDSSHDHLSAVVGVPEAKAAAPTLKVLILSSESDDESALSFIECGANGYLSKHSSLAQLVDAIKATYRGEMSYSPHLISLVVCKLRKLSKERDQLSPLSWREKQILELVSNGLGNKEIGNQLGISTATAKNHVHNILQKLKVTRRREAIRPEFLTNVVTQPFSNSHAPAAHSRRTLVNGSRQPVLKICGKPQ
jgi:DNA-binding NarL/FixJ family response regulator